MELISLIREMLANDMAAEQKSKIDSARKKNQKSRDLYKYPDVAAIQGAAAQIYHMIVNEWAAHNAEMRRRWVLCKGLKPAVEPVRGIGCSRSCKLAVLSAF